MTNSKTDKDIIVTKKCLSIPWFKILQDLFIYPHLTNISGNYHFTLTEIMNIKDSLSNLSNIVNHLNLIVHVGVYHCLAIIENGNVSNSQNSSILCSKPIILPG